MQNKLLIRPKRSLRVIKLQLESFLIIRHLWTSYKLKYLTLKLKNLIASVALEP